MTKKIYNGYEFNASMKIQDMDELPEWTVDDKRRILKLRGGGLYFGNDTKWTQVEAFETGTSMLFNQATAPVGWTKKSDWDDNATLIVGNDYGTGGSDDPLSWTTAIGDHALHTHTGPSHYHSTDGHALTEDEIPAHAHTYLKAYGSTTGGLDINAGGGISGSTTNTSSVGSGASHSHGNTGENGTGNTGSGGPTTHTQDTYTPKYVISIAAIKN